MLLCDTGVLLAAGNVKDHHHAACLTLMRAAEGPRIAELVEQYVSLPLGIVDAAVIAIAERLNLTEVATVDRKHFSIVRPRHVPAFGLLPEAL